MASVNFLLRSVAKKNAPFTIRVQFSDPKKITDKNPYGTTTIAAKTNIYVFLPEEVKDMPLVDGMMFWKDFGNKKQVSDPSARERVSRIKSEQKYLEFYVLEKLSEIEEQLPTKDWLSMVVRKYYDNLKRKKDTIKETPTDLTYHFDNYIKIKSLELKDSTILKLKDTKNIVLDYEKYVSNIKGYTYKVEIPNIDDLLKYEFVTYLKSQKHYAHNTIVKTIRVIRTICNYSTRYGINLHKRYVDFKLNYEDTDVVYLSFDELKLIKNTDVPEELQTAKEWLYLSCFLGQRISDFMRFDKSMIQKKGDKYTIEFTQTKTEKKLSLLIHPEVLEYLKNHDFNFPDKIQETKYNDQIKEVCRLAGITEKIKGSVLKEIKKGVFRNVTDVYPKYELIGSHIGRKSYASNFYGLIPTTLIMQVTGHSEERTLLEYIGKKDDTNNELIQDYYNRIKI